MAYSTPDSTAVAHDAFSPAQHRVLALLATGCSVTAAAKSCEIDRTTIHHWTRTNSAFALAAQDAALDAREAHRTAAFAHAEAAFNTLRQILDDEDAPASVRCKAALYILNTSKSVETERQLPQRPTLPAPAATRPATASAAKTSATPQHSTQFNTFADIFARDKTPAQVGRNTPCPCGSGRKFKQCCLNSTKPRAVAAATA